MRSAGRGAAERWRPLAHDHHAARMNREPRPARCGLAGVAGAGGADGRRARALTAPTCRPSCRARPSAAQQLLVEQLRDGLAARLILIGIEGGDARHARAACRRHWPPGCARRARVRQCQQRRAADQHRGSRVPVRASLSAQRRRDPRALQRRRACTRPSSDSLDPLASPAGPLAQSLFRARSDRRDAAGHRSARAAARRRGSEQGVWSSRDGERALLLAETRAPAPTPMRRHALALIAARTAAPSPMRDGLRERRAAGSARAGAAPAAQRPRGIRGRCARDHRARGTAALVLSTALIVTLLLLVYRSVPTLLLGLLPVASGALAGVAAVALGVRCRPWHHARLRRHADRRVGGLLDLPVRAVTARSRRQPRPPAAALQART